MLCLQRDYKNRAFTFKMICPVQFYSVLQTAAQQRVMYFTVLFEGNEIKPLPNIVWTFFNCLNKYL